ncbi:hypothetical protein C5167_040959 [Papaver somniferum]|uniref:WRC domain-containing protein n=1 Tax=Papaver somniferum TaxID=3469 RepID=A0A4Y7IIU4_PAPSO|nr:uncharacterized protein LOC113320877 [Papaver somniferum]RZC48006.1 hypothetical protein C5167_040959 [Papaver somniferum]
MENQKKPHVNSVNVIPPDDQRCRRSDGRGWRCKNILSSSHNPSYYCDQHYNSDWYQTKHKKQIQRGELGKPTHDSSDDEIQLKKQRVETAEKSIDHQFKKSRELEEEEEETQMVKLEKILGVCKKKCLELLAELDQKAMECIGIQGELDELESMKIAAENELKEFKRSQERRRSLDGLGWGKKEERTSGRISYLEGELKRLEKDMEHEKGEVEFWRNKFFDSEVRVLRMENGSVESRIYLPNDAPHSGETVGDNELSQQGRHCSRVSEFQTKGKVLNKDEVDKNAHRRVKEEVLGCPDMSIPSGSPNFSCGGQKAENVNVRVERRSLESNKNSNDKVGKTVAVNSVALICLDSDDESDSESPGEVMDRMPMNYRNKVKEVKWESVADMLSSFGKDSELCMRAVCALYRHQTSEEKSSKGLFRNFDAVRIKTLAEFLMNGDCKGELQKSVKELEEEYTSEALEDCKRLASSYSKQLFSIYKDKQDPLFLPTSTASC